MGAFALTRWVICRPDELLDKDTPFRYSASFVSIPLRRMKTTLYRSPGQVALSCLSHYHPYFLNHLRQP
jgi:hypothetical protein